MKQKRFINVYVLQGGTFKMGWINLNGSNLQENAVGMLEIGTFIFSP